MTEQQLQQQIDAIAVGPSSIAAANVRLLQRLCVQDLQRGAFHPEHNRKVTLEEIIGMMAAHDPNHFAQIEGLKQKAGAAGGST